MPFREANYPASSNTASGAMEQAGAGAHAGNAAGITSNPASGAAVGGGMAGGVTGQTTAGDMVCVPGNVAAPVTTGEKKFVVMEDHAVHKERVERWTEHQPVEREYVTKVEETGAVKAAPGYVDGALGGERVVNEHTCFPTNTTTVHGVAGLAETEANRATGAASRV